MRILKIFLLFGIFINLAIFDANSVTHEKFKKQLKNTKDKIDKLNKNSPKSNSSKSNSSKSKDVNIKNKTTSKTDATCRQGKNFIFYGKTDKYVRVLGPEKFKDQKQMLANFSFLSQRPNKNYFVEYVFKTDGTVTATNMTSCKSITYNWKFKGRSRSNDIIVYLQRPKTKILEMSIGLSNSQNKNKIRFHTPGNYDVNDSASRRLYANCYNYQNPMCNQFLAETLLVGFRDLKGNKSYAQLKKTYLAKVAEIKKKKEQEELEAFKKREAKAQKQREQELRDRKKREQQRQQERERAEKRKAYRNSPTGILESSYQNYMLIKGFYEARKGYVLQYVNSSQFSTAKSQIKSIEKKLVRKHRIDSNKIWNQTSEWYKQNWSSTIELYKSSGTYNQRAQGLVKLYIMSLNSTYNNVVKGGPSGMKKDF
tara:strand:- start:342 stop:1616 length:1275 start_codon:yes stop_codon:yes gene_type:complete